MKNKEWNDQKRKFTFKLQYRNTVVYKTSIITIFYYGAKSI